MVDIVPLQVEANLKPRLPIEACERVIEALYEDRVSVAKEASAALSTCALVCRSWRPRAQRILFEQVILPDKHALLLFAALVKSSPEIGSYVRRLGLRGYLHVPDSPVVLFPTVLARKLTALSGVFIWDVAEWEYVRGKPQETSAKRLPALPIHRSFPYLLNSISHIRQLELISTRFPSFGDFIRILNALPNLEKLGCHRVSWFHPVLKPPFCYVTAYTRKTFLQKVEMFWCHDMEEQGRQILLNALGPSFRQLLLKFPNDAPRTSKLEGSPAQENHPVLAPDLGSFRRLDDLFCFLEPLQPYDSAPQTLTLVSPGSARLR